MFYKKKGFDTIDIGKTEEACELPKFSKTEQQPLMTPGLRSQLDAMNKERDEANKKKQQEKNKNKQADKARARTRNKRRRRRKTRRLALGRHRSIYL